MRLVCIDCEGPITVNDNAFEICQHFLPRGKKFFTLVSRYDDYLADIINREGYTAGNTLKFIVPFFKAYGLTNRQIEDFSRRSLRFVPGAREMLSQLKKINTFIISTSYSPYIQALCKVSGFPVANTFSTFLNLDGHNLSGEEKGELIKLYRDILGFYLSSPERQDTQKIAFPDRETLSRLDEIFFRIIPSMQCSSLLEEVNPVGGTEKAQAVKSAASQTACRIEDTIYIGDSITDVEALRLVRKKRGISVSFNGNTYAMRDAEFACISSRTAPLRVIINRFYTEGKMGVEKLASTWPDSSPTSSIFTLITQDNLPSLVEKGEKMRKQVRGVEVGELG